MFATFYTLAPVDGPKTDHYETWESHSDARDHYREMLKKEEFYAGGFGPILDAADSPWVEIDPRLIAAGLQALVWATTDDANQAGIRANGAEFWHHPSAQAKDSALRDAKANAELSR